MIQQLDRRQILATLGTIGIAPLIPSRANAATEDMVNQPFRFCLNTSTIRGQNLSLREQIRIAARAGYEGIEPWMSDIHQLSEQGETLEDVGKWIADLGLTVESAIGFARWIVDDDAERAEGLRNAERDMLAVKAIGGTRIAAPPVGADGPMDLDLVAERYHDLLVVGAKVGVVPQLELWGHSPAIHKLGQLAYVAAEAAHPDVCMLPDVYHIYKGGSDFHGLHAIEGSRMHVFHMNDYPAAPSRESIGDQHRVYPGDGVAPLTQIIRDLRETGFRGAFSLELFNRDYWQRDPLEVARTGLAKMREVVASALSR